MSIINDLKERKVIRTAISYAVVAFVIMQIMEIVFPAFDFPQWTQQFVIILLFLGFPIAIVISWIFDKNPAGISKTSSNPKQKSLTWKIALASSVFALILYFSFDKLFFNNETNVTNTQKRENSIAVLPFNNFSKEQNDQFFSDGLTEDIITQLSKINGLKVISRTSVMEYKETSKKLMDIAKELNVVNILEGSVRVVGDKIRINAQLIDAFTDDHIWAETYDRPAEDIFAVQTDVAKKIALVLETEISPEEEKLITTKATLNVEAYNLFLKGKSEYYNYDVESMKRSIENYKKAIKIDPSYALAYAEMGNSYGQLYFRDGFDQNIKDLALSYVDKALSFDENIDVAYKAKALTLSWSGEILEAIKNNQIAISINPNNMEALTNLASSYGDMGDIKAALEGINKALELSPSNTVVRFYHYQNLYRLGKDDEALESLRIGLEKAPNSFQIMNALIMHYSFKKDQKNALLNLNTLKTIRKGDNRTNRPELFYNYIFGNAKVGIDAYERINKPNHQSKILALYLYKELGNKNKSDELIKELENFHLNQYNEKKGGNFSTTILSRLYAIKGDTDSSLDWMRKSIDMGVRNYKSFQAYPEFNKIRRDSRFLELLDRMEDLVQIERMKIQNNI
jgi:TolB-like protein/Tfp pilus assembly protein PilF